MNRKEFIQNTGLMALGASLLPMLGYGKEAPGTQLFNTIRNADDAYDAIVVGGSYAGLSAALTLARCLRKVLVLDTRKPRNRFAQKAHNAYMMDGVPPAEIQENATQQLSPYQQYLDVLNDEATNVTKQEDAFVVTTKGAKEIKAGFVVFATGATDTLPNIKGLKEQWGKNVNHCPYCHGFESRTGKTMLISKNFQGLELLSSLQHWSDQLSIAFQTKAAVPEQLTNFMKAKAIKWTTQDITELRSQSNGKLKEVVYADGTTEAVDHIYLKTQTNYQTQLAEKLGCEKDTTERLVTDDFMLTNQAGVYAIGDISAKSMGQIIWAANSGLMAAVHINNTMIANSLKG